MRSTRSFRALVLMGVVLSVGLLAVDVAARGGRGGGGGGRGGGMSRGGGGFSRGGGGGYSRPNINRGGSASMGSMRGGGFGGAPRPAQRPSVGGPSQGPGLGNRPGQGPGVGNRPAGPGQGAGIGNRPGDRPGAGDRPGPGDRPNSGDRQDNRDDRRDNWQDNRDDRQEFRQDRIQDRQEFRQDAWKEYGYHGYDEWYEDQWKYALGATLTIATFQALACQPTVVMVGTVSYYQCASTWYQRTYSGGSVTYIVVNPPAGY